tara:strand:- start:268 stop:666 length:399 start_codon:yes stop_codon:yes gene_type:complete
MYHEYPYKAQIPVLIEGKYTTRTFTSNDEVWDVIRLIIDETKEENKKGGSFNIAGSVMAQLPFFACTNIIMDTKAQQDIARFMYSRQFNISPYKGSYGEQPKKWVEKSFLLNNLIETQKAKAIRDGRQHSKN